MNNGGPAFPCTDTSDTFHGMTLRDYFAAQALPAIIAKLDSKTLEEFGFESSTVFAEEAYKVADAMLRER